MQHRQDQQGKKHKIFLTKTTIEAAHKQMKSTKNPFDSLSELEVKENNSQ